MDSKMMKTIGQRLNAALAEKDVKQKELAEHLGLNNENTVSYWCSGKRTPNTELIIKISKRLDVSTDYLLGLSDAPTNDKDLQFVCDYTGLNLETVRFFAESKNDDPFCSNDVKEFVECLVNLSARSDIPVSFRELRSLVTQLNDLYWFDERTNLDTLEYYAEQASDLELWVNGQKYKINKFLNDVIDCYSFLDEEGLEQESFEERAENFYHRIRELRIEEHKKAEGGADEEH